ESWVDISGKGFYENTHRQLYEIPDSPFFQFEGQAYTGLVIRGRQERLRLEIQPLIPRETSGNTESLFAMGSAAAVLYWKERTIPGRVIYEYLVMRNANRLSQRFRLSMLFGGADFQGLYLRGCADDDLYFQGSHSEFARSLMGPVLGFNVLAGEQDPAADLQIEVIDYTIAAGFFRWPT